MRLSAIVDALVRTGATAEQVAAVVRAYDDEREASAAVEEAKSQKKRADNAARQRRFKAKNNANNADNALGNADNALPDVSGVTTSPLKERSPPTPPSKENNPPQSVSSLRSETDIAIARKVQADFERFYAVYPKRSNRKAAIQTFCVAVKSGVDPEHIIAAAGRFAEAHRLSGTDKQYIPAPNVWLNKGKYDDEDLPAPVANARAGPARIGDRENGFLGSLKKSTESVVNEREAAAFSGNVLSLPLISSSG